MPAAHHAVADAFVARFDVTPTLFAAPGRINLIGEHTDYSGGFAMPAAIDRRCVVACAPNGTGLLRLHSLTLDATTQRSLSAFTRAGDWSDYVGAVAASLQRAGVRVPGCDLTIGGDVPLGAGVSSSAALEVAVALALLDASGVGASREELVRRTWEAETDFVGAPCGPMDQFACVYGEKDAALLLDCCALTATPVRLPPGSAVFLVESGVRHRIVDGGYAARRRDCEEAARLLDIASLRDASQCMLDRSALPERLHRRARHVISENARVHAMATALAAGDLPTAGRLMSDSHSSLRDDFDVTCAETDRLAHIASATPGVFGARQLGGGFGGAVIALASADEADAAAEAMACAYRRGTELGGNWFRCTLAGGAGRIA